MKKIFLMIPLFSYFYLAQAKTIEHKDINSTIERLDTTDWDPLYYQYRIVNNVPYQYDKVKNEYFFNPIYGVFFLKQYQKKYNITKNIKYVRYIELLTKSLLQKSEYHHNARIFNYAPTGNVSRMYHKHYSGLTQSYYVEVYANLYKIFGNPYYKKLAIEFVNSIAIEKKDGGVLFHRDNLYGIEEVPSEPNEWILNGWLSAIVSLHRGNEVLKDKVLADLIRKNVNTLDRIIHLYDVPQLANSRYSLTQFFYFRIRQSEYTIRKVTFTYPMDKKVSLAIQPKSFAGLNGQKLSRWQPHFIYREGMRIDTYKNVVRGQNMFQFNGVLSRIAYPDLGTINVEYIHPLKIKPKVDCYIGTYDPLSRAPVNGKWVTFPSSAVEIRDNVLIIKPEPKLFDLMLGYPTNFIKKFTGGRINAYNDIHILHLYFLGKYYGKPRLSKMAEKWKGYKSDWRTHHSYKNLFDHNKVLIDDKFIEQWDKKIL